MTIDDLRNILIQKGLADLSNNSRIENNNDFVYIMNKYGYTKILYDYSIPFITNNRYPEGLNSTNFLSNESWSYLTNTTFNKIYNFFEFDVWFGNYITEILHDAENVLKGAFKNLLTEYLNMNDEFTFSFDNDNNENNINFLLALWNISRNDLSNLGNSIYSNRNLFSELDNVLGKIFKTQYYFNRRETWQNKLKRYSILEWVEVMSFGAFVNFLKIFNKRNPDAFLIMIRSYFANFRRRIDIGMRSTRNNFFNENPKLFLYFYSCIADLRNAISHNKVIYNYKFFNLNSFESYFYESEEIKRNAIINFISYMYSTAIRSRIQYTRYLRNNRNDRQILRINDLSSMSLEQLITEAERYTTYTSTSFIINLLEDNLNTRKKRTHFKLILATIDENIEIFLNSLKDQSIQITNYILRKMF